MRAAFQSIATQSARLLHWRKYSVLATLAIATAGATIGRLESSERIALTSAANMSGTSYYVSPSGDDTNSGTRTTAPWRTLAKVQGYQANLKPGDKVLLQRGGIWYEQLTITNMNGASGSPIIISNYGEGNLPVIDGGQTSSGTGRNYCIYANNTKFKWITIDGIECRNAYKQGITFRAYSGVGTNGVGIVVRGSYIHHSGVGACITCRAEPPPDPGGYQNQLDAQLTTGVQFLNNTLDHLGGHNAVNVHYDTGGPVVKANVVGTNAPYCNHNCIDLKGVVRGQVIDNVVTCPRCPKGTVAFYTENTGYNGVRDETITYIGNVAYSVPIGFQMESGGTCRSYPCSISAKYYNNTIYNPRFFNFMDTSCTHHTLDIQKNIVDGGEINIHSGCTVLWDYNLNGGVHATTGSRSGLHDIKRANPHYVNADGGNFTPQNSTILTYGRNSQVTPFPFLGALGGERNLTRRSSSQPGEDHSQSRTN